MFRLGLAGFRSSLVGFGLGLGVMPSTVEFGLGLVGFRLGLVGFGIGLGVRPRLG